MYFVLVSVVILAAKAIPPLRKLLQYGKVAQVGQSRSLDSQLAKFVDLVVQMKVPKTWFAHFYVVFALLQWGQVLWAPEAILRGSKYLVVWGLLTIQASRRMLESFFLTNWGSKSKMHISHYLVGVLFYVGISSICWIGLTDTKESVAQFGWKDLVAIVTFSVFSLDQWSNHRHLALLVKYSVPTYGLFLVVSSAHYLDEILIYLAIFSETLLHSPFTNTDVALFASWIFVLVNLSVSALETHSYYRVKFDGYSVQYAVIPYAL